MKHWDRREFLALLASLPGVVLIGCGTGGEETGVKALSPRDSMKKLILALGPWTEDQKAEAERFADRFLAGRPAL
jgi:hypothetical protein